MSVDVRSDLIQGTDTCRECPAPIAQSGRGPRKVFCAACIARRGAQQSREWRAGRMPDPVPTACQDCAAPVGGRKVFCDPCVVLRAARAQCRWRARRTPEWKATNNQYKREQYAGSTREQRAVRAEHDRESRLQRKYGIGAAGFDALLAAQDSRCAICGTDEPNGHGWHVDHDHESGAFRGILCPTCNVGLGHFMDDPAILRAAAAYIESHARRTS